MSRTRPLHLEVHEKSASTSEGVWNPHYRRLTLGLILLTFGPGLEGLAAATILPKIVADLGGLSLYGWSFSAFLLATIVGLILAGDEADRKGPTLPFMLGVALFVLGLILAGTASSMLMFVLSRGVQGLGAGALDSVAYVCLGRGYPEQVKPRMIAVLSSCWVAPGLIGPALAGIVVALAGWRWVFLGLVPLVPLAAVLVLPALKKLTPATISGSWDLHRLFAAGGLVIGAGMTLSGLQVPSVPLALVLTLPGLLVGTLSLHRILPPGTLKAQAGMPAAIATMGLLSLAYYGGEAFLPLTLIAIRGQSTLIAGLTLTAATLTWTAGSWVQAQLAPRQGPSQESCHWWQRWGLWVQAQLAPRQDRRLLVTAGLLLIALGLAGIASVLIPGIPAVVAVVAWGVGGLGMGLAYSTISLVVLETAPPGWPGRFGNGIDGACFRTRISARCWSWRSDHRGDLGCRERSRDRDCCGRYLRPSGNWPRHPDRRSIPRSTATHCVSHLARRPKRLFRAYGHPQRSQQSRTSAARDQPAQARFRSESPPRPRPGLPPAPLATDRQRSSGNRRRLSRAYGP